MTRFPCPIFLPRHLRRGLALNQSDGTAKQRQWTQGTKGMGQNMWNLRLIPNCSDYALTILDLENVAPHFLISGKKWSIKLHFFFRASGAAGAPLNHTPALEPLLDRTMS